MHSNRCPGIRVGRLLPALALPLLAAALPPSPARADVTWTQVLRASGPLSVGGGSPAKATCRVSGERARCDLSAPPELLEPLRRQAGDAEVRIVRLDEGTVLSLPGDGTVLEETFAERKARLDRLVAERGEPWPFEDVAVEISPTKSTEQIDELECEDVRVVIRGSFHPAGGSKIPVTLEADVWVASAFPGRSQVDGFARKESTALGMDPLQPRLLTLIDVRYSAVVREFVRALAQVGGTPIRVGATLYGAQMGSLSNLIEQKRGGGEGGPGLVEMNQQGSTLVTRKDRGGPTSVRGPRTGDWNLALFVTGIEEGSVDPAQFEPPAGARKLVPKSRHKAEEPPAKPVAGGNPSQ